MRRTIRSKRLMKALQAARDLPGAELFTWIGADGAPHSVGSSSLNAYLAEIGGDGAFTAKTFRTWAGTVEAFRHHRAHPEAGIGAMADAAAERLANTPTVARNSYIHPAVLDLAGNGTAPDLPPARAGLNQHETALLEIIG